mgnify:CR=1 FL=1
MDKNQFLITNIKKYEEKSRQYLNNLLYPVLALGAVRMLLWYFDDSLKPYVEDLISHMAIILYTASASYNVGKSLSYSKVANELKEGIDGELENSSSKNGR